MRIKVTLRIDETHQKADLNLTTVFYFNVFEMQAPELNLSSGSQRLSTPHSRAGAFFRCYGHSGLTSPRRRRFNLCISIVILPAIAPDDAHKNNLVNFSIADVMGASFESISSSMLNFFDPIHLEIFTTVQNCIFASDGV